MSQAVDSWSKEMFAAAVCRLLRDSRRRQKLTQAQVAARTGGLISKAALANYETGHRSLRVDVLWVVAKALGENIGSLVANAERGIGHRQDADGSSPITIDIEEIRENGDQRLGSVRRWLDLQQAARQSPSGLMTLDPGAIAALSSLMGVTPSECRAILSTVAGRLQANGKAAGTQTDPPPLEAPGSDLGAAVPDRDTPVDDLDAPAGLDGAVSDMDTTKV